MAVTLTDIELAASLRIGNGVDALVEPQAGVITRLLEMATKTVEDYTPDAPESIQNEAVVRLCGYLYDSPHSNRMGNPFADSGAQSLLSRYRLIRAVSLDSVEDDSE